METFKDAIGASMQKKSYTLMIWLHKRYKFHEPLVNLTILVVMYYNQISRCSNNIWAIN